FITFSILIVAAALYSPAVTMEPGQWRVMAEHDTALRYWFIPGMCLLAVLAWSAVKAPPKAIRLISIAALLLAPVGVILDWRVPPLADLDFQSHAAAFEATESGTTLKIPINPNWEMT